MSVVQRVIDEQAARDARVPFLKAWVEKDGFDTIVPLPLARGPVTVGRIGDCDIHLSGDARASRHHATLEPAYKTWYVKDERSLNGTQLNCVELTSAARLHDGDDLCFGETCFTYHDPREPVHTLSGSRDGYPTERAALWEAELSGARRRVLRELCRPLQTDRRARPASNQDIAEALVVEVGTVKAVLNKLYKDFQLDRLGQVEKRMKLAHGALESRLITPQEFKPSGRPAMLV